MEQANRLNDNRIPPIGVLTQAERMLRANWVANELRSPSGIPMLSPDFVSRQGRVVRLIDLREPDELMGPLGYIPGVDWFSREEALRLHEKVGEFEPIVLISRGGERSGEIAKHLEGKGLKLVASMMGGMVSWKEQGFYTTRDAGILSAKNSLRPYSPRWESKKGSLTQEEIEKHVGDVHSIRWVKLAAFLLHGRLSCVDGRDDSGVLGTPGGDMGEFLLATSVVERLCHKKLNAQELKILFLRRLDAFGRFYLHSDVSASNTLIASMRQDKRLDAALSNVYEAMEWRRFLAKPPVEIREVLLEHILRPEHIGCGHMKQALLRHVEYGTRPELVLDLFRSYLTVRWEGATEADYVVLPGGHNEGAVINVMLSEELAPFSKIPLVSPAAEGSQMFVNHPQVSAYLRRQLAEFFVRQTDLFSPPAGGSALIYEEITKLAQTHLVNTLGVLAKGLPIFHLTFNNDMNVSVQHMGNV
jgi:rhodanese-related sulfurtransferase